MKIDLTNWNMQKMASQYDFDTSEKADLLERLISEIYHYPILWNKQAPEYKESHKKRIVWKQISLKLEVEG